MIKQKLRIKEQKLRRKQRVRARIFGTENRPRLNVKRSNTGIYAQLIDDDAGKTMVSVNMKEIKQSGTKKEASTVLGELLAKKALEKNIKQAVFDRAENKYHGRVAAFAEAARKGGLKI
ncbi:MAG: 50S ribosomal protein L18 [bacterium]|nr:50S ribosomal protein L18 [bacterium]